MTVQYLPKRALFRDKPATVIGYVGEGRWLIVDSNDLERVVSASRLTFIK